VLAARTLSDVIEIYKLSYSFERSELIQDYDFCINQMLKSYPLPTFSSLMLALFKMIWGCSGLK
jgi:hypothetical protein